MTLSQSRFAYNDCYEVMNKAIDDPKGIRVRVDDYNAGIHLRMRIHQARSIDRDDNRKTYANDHPMYGRSPYDRLIVRAPVEDIDGNWWVRLDKPEANIYEIESLTDGPPMIEAEYEQVEVLEDHTVEPPKQITFQRRF